MAFNRWRGALSRDAGKEEKIMNSYNHMMGYFLGAAEAAKAEVVPLTSLPAGSAAQTIKDMQDLNAILLAGKAAGKDLTKTVGVDKLLKAVKEKKKVKVDNKGNVQIEGSSDFMTYLPYILGGTVAIGIVIYMMKRK